MVILNCKIKALEDYKIIQGACGLTHSVVLTSQGELFTWGKISSNNSKGKKIDYSQLDYFTPQRLNKFPLINGLPDKNEPYYVKISCGLTHNAAFDKLGRLYTWGDA
jgi:alpha-tubulin suppressor-like RCC1 family protein